jgi:TFIIF-interacting CTD phosphatase-like protein
MKVHSSPEMRNKFLSIITSAVPFTNLPANPVFSTPSVKTSEGKTLSHFLSTPSNKSSKIELQPSVNKKTLFIDLDETLVHSTFEKIDDADYIIPVILLLR